MRIELENTGKRYIYEWIFRGLSHSLESGQGYAITGPNGSGKSTLMQVLSGYLTPTEGGIRFIHDNKTLFPQDVYQFVSFCSPSMELIEEFTLTEAIRFHFQFKKMLAGITNEVIIDLLGFPQNVKSRQIKHFSSGMKQRLKLALAVLSDTSILLLDEPTITLDKQGVGWYNQLLEQYLGTSRLLVIASNVPEDFIMCKHQIHILDYKQVKA